MYTGIEGGGAGISGTPPPKKIYIYIYFSIRLNVIFFMVLPDVYLDPGDGDDLREGQHVLPVAGNSTWDKNSRI